MQSKIPIGIQLFSVRGECQKDLPATLEAVSRIGYVGVEPWGYSGESVDWMGYSASELRLSSLPSIRCEMCIPVQI